MDTQGPNSPDSVDSSLPSSGNPGESHNARDPGGAKLSDQSSEPGRTEVPSSEIARLRDLKWLHDKYERLAYHEDVLLVNRSNLLTTYMTALVAAQALVLAYFHGWNLTDNGIHLVVPVVGLLLSFYFGPVIRRTVHANRLYRAAARVLEQEGLVGDELSKNPGLTRLTGENLAGTNETMVFLRRIRDESIDLTQPFSLYYSAFRLKSALAGPPIRMGFWYREVRSKNHDGWIDRSSPTRAAKSLPQITAFGWELILAVTIGFTTVETQVLWSGLWVTGLVVAGMIFLFMYFALRRALDY